MISHRCKHVLKGLKLSTSLTWEDHTSIFPEDTRWLSWKMPEYSLLLAVVSIKSLIWFRICCKKLCFLVCFHSFHFFDSFWMLGLWVLSKIFTSWGPTPIFTTWRLLTKIPSRRLGAPEIQVPESQWARLVGESRNQDPVSVGPVLGVEEIMQQKQQKRDVWTWKQLEQGWNYHVFQQLC